MELYQIWEKKIAALDVLAQQLHDMSQLAAGDSGRYILKTEMEREHLSREITNDVETDNDLCLSHIMYKGLYEQAREYKGFIMVFAKTMPLEQRRELIDQLRKVFRQDAQTDNDWQRVLTQFASSLKSQGYGE